MLLNGRLGMVFGLLVSFAGAGCDIHNCGPGEGCAGPGAKGDYPSAGGGSEQDQCYSYCARVNLCGGPRGDDIEACVDACQIRFQVVPDETAALCACAARSACSDVNEGRCSGEPSSGGGSDHSGSGTGTGTAGVTGAGGAPSAGGSSGTGTGTAGSNAGGAPSAGGSSGTGTGTAGSDAGQSSGTPCAHDCDCPANEYCHAGHCGP